MKKIKDKSKEKKKRNKITKIDCHFNMLFESDPKKIKFLENLPIKNAHFDSSIKSFCLFKSIDDILVLCYISYGKNIIAYNINDKKIMLSLKGFKININYINHYLDIINNRDLLLEICCGEEYEPKNNMFIWDFNKIECILHLENIYTEGLIYSASCLNVNNQIFFIVGSEKGKKYSEPMICFDFNGKKIKEIKNSKYNIYIIETYYVKKLNKNFIIVVSNDALRSYDYNENKIYKKYYNKTNNIIGDTIVINGERNPLKLMECDFNGELRIFNFHTGDLLYSNLKRGNWNGFCHWNDNYFFVPTNYDRFCLLNSSSDKNVIYFKGHNSQVFYIVKLIHPKYGECLMSIDNYSIKLWITNSN